MIIEIEEWETRADQVLTADQVAAFAASDIIRIRPGSYGRWTLRAKSHVGVFHAAGIEMRIRPKVAVHRLLKLLCETIERVAWHDADTMWADDEDLLVTVAGSFCGQAERVVHGGLLQGYRTIDEALFAVKGRIDVGRQLSRQAGMVLPVEVSYDEYSTNVVENQLLAGATKLLLKLPLPGLLRTRLRRLQQLFVDIEPTRPSTAPPDVVWSRLNLRYRAAATLARLVLRSCSLDDGDDRPTTGTNFLVDMNQVFEDIVGRGLRAHIETLAGGTVELQKTDRLDNSGHLAIRPDIVWEQNGVVRAVADVKYKQPDEKGIGNPDVYQAVTYATRYRLDRCTLIYATQPPVKSLQIQDIAVDLVHVDLGGTRDDRDAQIARLAADLVAGRTADGAQANYESYA